LTAREGKVNVALSNSMGFGGHNAVLAFRKYVG
jgi:3-oxoacyl-[acyl-carrier-protein] synthase II